MERQKSDAFEIYMEIYSWATGTYQYNLKSEIILKISLLVVELLPNYSTLLQSRLTVSSLFLKIWPNGHFTSGYNVVHDSNYIIHIVSISSCTDSKKKGLKWWRWWRVYMRNSNFIIQSVTTPNSHVSK